VDAGGGDPAGRVRGAAAERGVDTGKLGIGGGSAPHCWRHCRIPSHWCEGTLPGHSARYRPHRRPLRWPNGWLSRTTPGFAMSWSWPSPASANGPVRAEFQVHFWSPRKVQLAGRRCQRFRRGGRNRWWVGDPVPGESGMGSRRPSPPPPPSGARAAAPAYQNFIWKSPRHRSSAWSPRWFRSGRNDATWRRAWCARCRDGGSPPRGSRRRRARRRVWLAAPPARGW
jgi:hypothetical protein